MTRSGAIAAVGAIIGAVAGLIGPASADESSVRAALASRNLMSMVGISSYYGAEFHGRRTADGEIFDMRGLTAAHKTLPIPCYARVTNLDNGRSVVVRVNDRGPYVGGRMLDVSEQVAHLLAFSGGMSRVRLDYLGKAGPAGAEDQRALLASLRLGGEPLLAARRTPTDGVSVAERAPPALAFASSAAPAPAAAALAAAIRPVADTPAPPPLSTAAKLDASLRRLEAGLEAAPHAAVAQAVKAVSPYGDLVIAPFKPLIEASK